MRFLSNVGALFLGLILLASCSSGNEKQGSNDMKKLPIMGRKQYVKKEVDGQQKIVDTIYHQIPDYKFVDQDSNYVTPKTFEGKVYVADFFFTTCPTICPVMERNLLRVYKKYKGNSEVAFLSHTIDPDHDSVSILKDYAERLGVNDAKQWHFVTGAKDKIYQIGQQSYMVSAMEDKNSPGGYIHSGAFILVDKDRHVRGIYDGTKKDDVDRLMKDMDTLLKEYKG